MDIRKRAVALRSAAEVSQRLMISKRSVERYWSYWQENQELPKDQRKGKPATKLRGHEASIIKWVEQREDITHQFHKNVFN